MDRGQQVDDFYIVNMTVEVETKFIIGTLYIQPNLPQSINYFTSEMHGA
jgi:hypothetical protein